MKEVYHTSGVRVENPDTRHSRKALDFGPGFYFTHPRHQAEQYGKRRLKLKMPAFLNVYEMKEEWNGWKVKTFENYDSEWLEFVLDCRNYKVVGDYDMVVGGIADDKVFDTLTLFFEQLIDKKEALRRLKYEKPNIQYCIRTEAMIKDLLTFKECIRL